MDIRLLCLKCIQADGRQKSGIRRKILESAEKPVLQFRISANDIRAVWMC